MKQTSHGLSHPSEPSTAWERQRWLLRVRGIVQGVGFRPFVYNTAQALGLTGWVKNTTGQVEILIEGPRQELESFIQALQDNRPAQSRIDALEVAEQPAGPTPLEGFQILASSQAEAVQPAIPADLAICADCRAEIHTPSERRYRYPFTNCTHCGPRWSIIRDLPYDRPRTSMAHFTMCPDCQAEYENPADRRFHAQPIACPRCGPKLRLLVRSSPAASASPGLPETLPDYVPAAEAEDALQQPAQSGKQIEWALVAEGEEALQQAAQAIREGRIVALKGLGGFQLLCDATRQEVVLELRRRKQRPDKPFALMFGHLDEVRQVCWVSEAEAALLQSAESPIVLLRRRRWPKSFDQPAQPSGILPLRKRPTEPMPGSGEGRLPEADRAEWEIASPVAPDNPYLGVMLPYTPLHELLMEAVGRPIVCTSGNLSEEPMAYRTTEAICRLGRIADLILTHNRPIVRPVDDSVVRVLPLPPDQLPSTPSPPAGEGQGEGVPSAPSPLAGELPSIPSPLAGEGQGEGVPSAPSPLAGELSSIPSPPAGEGQGEGDNSGGRNCLPLSSAGQGGVLPSPPHTADLAVGRPGPQRKKAGALLQPASVPAEKDQGCRRDVCGTGRPPHPASPSAPPASAAEGRGDGISPAGVSSVRKQLSDAPPLCPPRAGNPLVQVLRRARGYAPRPIELGVPMPTMLALGGHLKNTVGLSVGTQVVLSQHVGDLDNLASLEAFRRTVEDLLRFFRAEPERLVCDLHPDYTTTQYAEQLADRLGVPLLRVQHHEAHLAACLAEQGLPPEAWAEPILGFSWDGAGYGWDGTIWGGEVLLWQAGRVQRVGSLRSFLLPGGNQAVRQPRRSALAVLYALWGEQAWERFPPLKQWFSPSEQKGLRSMLRQETNCPRASSMGRLFDAVAALCGLGARISFEGQAAMALEFAALDESPPFQKPARQEAQNPSQMAAEPEDLIGTPPPAPKDAMANRPVWPAKPEAPPNAESDALSDAQLNAEPDELIEVGPAYPLPWIEVPEKSNLLKKPLPTPAKAAGREEATGAAERFGLWDWRPMVEAVLADRAAGVPVYQISRRFHAALADGILQAAQWAANRWGLRRVALSGGCFQNALLTQLVYHRLRQAGFTVYLHRHVPPGDGGIALGQLLLAAFSSHSAPRK